MNIYGPFFLEQVTLLLLLARANTVINNTYAARSLQLGMYILIL